MIMSDSCMVCHCTLPLPIDQPPSRPPTPHPSGPVKVDLSYYNKLMGNIPEDQVTIELIIHCMAEQVEYPICVPYGRLARCPLIEQSLILIEQSYI